jgi:hypothetical protein
MRRRPRSFHLSSITDIRLMAAIAALGTVLVGCSGGSGAHVGKPASVSRPTGEGELAGSAALLITSPPAAAMPAPTARPLPRKRLHELTWILTRHALGQVVSDPVIRVGLGRSHVYQLLQPGQKPLAWANSIPVVTFPAASELTHAVTSQQIPSGTRAVLYDPEAWPFTPANEQRHPVIAAGRAKVVTQRHGLALIAAPAMDLTKLHKGGHGQQWQKFLSLHLIGAMASNVNVIELQAQSLERDVSVYAEFVRRAAAQARAVNPRVRILAGLSTNPPGAPVTSGELVSAIEATARTVNGYWLNIPGRGARCPNCNPQQPGIGIAALRAVF